MRVAEKVRVHISLGQRALYRIEPRYKSFSVNKRTFCPFVMAIQTLVFTD